MTEHFMFIDGKDVSADSGASLTISNPATGRGIATVPDGGRVDVDKAVTAARTAFESGPWPRMSRTERAKVLLRVADALDVASESLFTLETENNGRPITETRAQLSRVPEWFRYNAGLLAAQRQAVLPSDGPYLTYQERLPLGVCGIITPFNHPLLILARSLSAALANGNTVVVKPSELTPLTTLALADIMTEAGLPDGVVNVVTGGREAGDRLTQHPDVAKITLTGGTEAGRAAADRHRGSIRPGDSRTRRQDPGHRVRRRRPGGRGRGRRLRRVRRGRANPASPVHDSWCSGNVYDEFVAALSARANAIRIGDPAQPDTQMGPLISARQRDKVHDFIETGSDEGARLAAGGGVPDLPERLRDGFFLQPTVLADATMDDARRPGGDLRPGRRRHPVRRRGATPCGWPTTTATASAPACGPPTSVAPTASRHPSWRAWSGSTTTTASNRPCRGAA